MFRRLCYGQRFQTSCFFCAQIRPLGVTRQCCGIESGISASLLCAAELVVCQKQCVSRHQRGTSHIQLLASFALSRRKMVSLVHTVDTAHSDMVHDAQTDYYGTRLATCSSDKSVKVFDVKNGTQKLIAVLTGHEGPVWQVAWAHPMFGTVLASCSYDRKVIVWMDVGGTWDKIYEYGDHDSSVNSISWAPHEFGLMLACASSDGAVSVLSMSGGGQWNTKKISNAHAIGCNAVSWAPAVTQPFIPENDTFPGTPGAGSQPGALKQFVTGGCDNLVKIWKYQELENEWVEEQKLEAHSDWVRDVAWAPSVGTSRSTIASCSQDCRVILWTCDNGSWSYNVLGTFADVVWLVSWNLTGNILAVSGGDNNVTLWKELIDGQWICISDTERDETDIAENVGA